MKTYVNNLIILSLVLQTAITLSPARWKKYVKYVCAAVLLVTIAAPIVSLGDGVRGIITQIEGIFSSDEGGSESSGDEKYYASAGAVIYWIGERYKIDKDGIDVVFREDEDGELCGIEVFMDSCPGVYAREIETVLTSEFEVEVRVIAGEEK